MNVEAGQKENRYRLEMALRLQRIYALAKVLEEIYCVSEEKGIEVDEILTKIFCGHEYDNILRKISHV